MEATAPPAHRGYCRGCGRDTLAAFSGWVTSDGRENTLRPRAFYRACNRCGLLRMVLGGDSRGGVPDTEGLCRNVIDNYLQAQTGRSGRDHRHRSRATATGQPIDVHEGQLDFEDALVVLMQIAWELYEAFIPQGNATFLGFASNVLPLRLYSWIRDETGDASGRAKGRVIPKAHSRSVSTSLEGLAEAAAVERGDDDPGGLDAVVTGRAGDLADDRSPDLARALAARSS